MGTGFCPCLPKRSPLQVDGADHFFRGSDDELVRHVVDWLRQLAVQG